MKRIAIIGSGHLGQQILYHIQQDTNDVVIGFFDDFLPKGILVKNLPILGGNQDITSAFGNNLFDEVVIAIGYKHMGFRSQIYNELVGKIPFYTFIHTSTIIDPSVKVGQGSIIYPGCLLDQDVVIGNNILINVGCTIAHDSVINDHTFLSPRVAIAGFVTIGTQSIIGINATIIDNIKIKAKTQLGGGTVVIKNIDDAGLYVGNPAKFVR